MQQELAHSKPHHIGKYEVIGELGHGGMAVVYRARHPQLQRDVAVKVLHPHLASDPESRARFRREAMAAARLKHPNIVEVYDFAEEADRDSFMVTELLEGPTLRRFAELHPGMPAEVAALVGIVLCEALQCAHEQGVVHRDVKPDNILLQSGSTLKLTDFGIAFVADAHGMTVTGQVLGSPAHMAPEQVEGRDIDARADLFAAGTVLYALAVGRLPFEAPNAHALLRKVMEAEYPDPLRIAPAIGHRFAAILRRCLEREPDQRYASALELRAALVSFVSEMGWDAPAETLKRYFATPDRVVAEHRTQLVPRLPELGQRARRAGDLPGALGYFNRALALDPGNAKVLAMVRGISRRQRVRRLTAGGLLVLGVAGVTALGAVFVARAVQSSRQHDASARAELRPDARPSSVTSSAPSEVGTTTPSSTTSVPLTHVAAVIPPIASNETGRDVASAVTTAVATIRRPERVPFRPAGLNRGASAHDPRAPAIWPVQVSIYPSGGILWIDNTSRGSYDPGTIVELSEGRHSFRFNSANANCDTESWTVTVEPVEGGGEPQRARHTLTCATRVPHRAAIQDSGAAEPGVPR